MKAKRKTPCAAVLLASAVGMRMVPPSVDVEHQYAPLEPGVAA